METSGRVWSPAAYGHSGGSPLRTSVVLDRALVLELALSVTVDNRGLAGLCERYQHVLYEPVSMSHVARVIRRDPRLRSRLVTIGDVDATLGAEWQRHTDASIARWKTDIAVIHRLQEYRRRLESPDPDERILSYVARLLMMPAAFDADLLLSRDRWPIVERVCALRDMALERQPATGTIDCYRASMPDVDHARDETPGSDGHDFRVWVACTGSMNTTAMPSEIVDESLRVFLCHSKGDKVKVRELYEQLSADGFSPWLDETNLIPGEDWDAEIKKTVRAAHVVIVCLSKNSVTTEGYVQKEIKMSLDIADEKPENASFIIPARLDECKVPSRLSKWQWVDLFAAEGYARLTKALQLRAARVSRQIDR